MCCRKCKTGKKSKCVRVCVDFKSVWINSVHKSSQLIFLLNVIIYFDRLCINSILYISCKRHTHTYTLHSREQVSVCMWMKGRKIKLIYSKLIDQVYNKYSQILFEKQIFPLRSCCAWECERFSFRLFGFRFKFFI